MIYKYREALFHGPLLPGPETRGLGLMHRDNIGGSIQGKLLSRTQKRQIEKFIFNGQKASSARPAFCDPMKTSGVCNKITSIFFQLLFMFVPS